MMSQRQVLLVLLVLLALLVLLVRFSNQMQWPPAGFGISLQPALFSLFVFLFLVNAVNSVSTGNGKSKFVHMPNSVNTLKILVGIYF